VSKEEVEIEEESDYLNVPAEPTLLEMKQSRSCDIIFSSQPPLYSKDDWQYLRDLWSSQQEGTKQVKLVKTKKKKKTNFISPIQSGQTIDGKGRGLFSTRDIKKGEMIFNGELQLDNLIKFTLMVNHIVNLFMQLKMMEWHVMLCYGHTQEGITLYSKLMRVL